jgi:hypothetical protein
VTTATRFAIGWALFAIVATVAVRAAGLPWWATAPVAAAGVLAVVLFTRRRA